MNKELFDYITDHQKIWCQIRENQKNIDRLNKSRFYSNKQKIKHQLLIDKLMKNSIIIQQ